MDVDHIILSGEGPADRDLLRDGISFVKHFINNEVGELAHHTSKHRREPHICSKGAMTPAWMMSEDDSCVPRVFVQSAEWTTTIKSVFSSAKLSSASAALNIAEQTVTYTMQDIEMLADVGTILSYTDGTQVSGLNEHDKRIHLLLIMHWSNPQIQWLERIIHLDLCTS